MGRMIFFGDSYTKGHGCLPGYDYYNYKSHGKIWTELISNHYGYDIVDFSNSGKCNEDIIFNLINFLTKLKKDDIIIVGTTSPVRTNFFLNGEQCSFSGRKASMTFNEFMNEQDNRLPVLGNRIPIEYDESLHSSLSTYVLNVKLPFYNQWDDYYTKIYENIEKLFHKNLFVWSYKIWFDFESITKDTNGKMKDSHWSWNGHYQFYEYLIPIINERFFK